MKIAVSGTGFIASGFVKLIQNHPHYKVSKVLSRRSSGLFFNTIFSSLVTNSIEEFVESADILVECSGDVLWATQVIDLAFKASKPVLTMNSEFQIVAGSYYQQFGILHESLGDQPGSLAALDNEVKSMGFKPVVYGSQKSFLNHNPDLKTIRYWAKKNNQSIEKTLSFTDGTKVQIEAALIANGLQTDILQQGLLGSISESTQKGAHKLAVLASTENKVISDYVLRQGGQGEVFIVAEHDIEHQDALSYFKLKGDPYYFFTTPFHLGYFEILKSIEIMKNGTMPLFNNGSIPTISVAAVAKCDLSIGRLDAQGMMGFKVRGIAVRLIDCPDHVPIGLLKNAEIKRGVKQGEIITFADVDLPDTLAKKAWLYTKKPSVKQIQKNIIL